MQLVLSLFSGVGLLDKAFKEKGFCVVSAGDLIYGHDIRDFAAVKNKFDGVIGGSPCQDFSTLKRERGTYSLEMVEEFIRVVKEAQPTWWLLENVKGVPDIEIDGYSHQRIDINQGWYSNTSRLRHIQFGHTDNLYLDIPRGDMSGVNHSCALATDDRSFKELCYLQGLDRDYDLPDFNMVGKKKAVGNGVPLVIGRVLADAVLTVTDPSYKSVTPRDIKSVTQQDEKRCSCGCQRILTGRKTYYDDSCRQRAKRKRDSNKNKIVKSNIYRCTEYCPNCPFLDNGKKMNLNDGRVDDIKDMLLNDLNSSFNCHKTVYNLDNDMNNTEEQDLKMCFGAYQFLKDNNKENLQMQLAKRLNIEEFENE